MSKEQKITNEIKVPNKDLEVLRIHFPHYFDKDGNFQLEKFKNNLTEKEINFSTESYGLDWLGKSYARLLASDPATTLLKADETHNSKPENANSENLLIKGDNLEVLKHLANAYYEQVKMIYIDPPYNTGSDGFVYNDDRKFTVKELQNLIGVDAEKAKRILDFTQSKSNSHSAWLTFMYPRLYIAKQLLKDDGVIFVSIDDNEVAQLRLLMDEVFGEENFVAEFIRKTKSISSDSKIGINSQHEYCISYSKNIEKINLIGFEKEYNGYSNPDNDPKGDWTSSDPTAMDDGRLNKNINPITNPHTGKVDYPGKGRRWRFNEDGFEKLVDEGRIIFKKKHKDSERGFILKRYKNELQSEYNVVQTLLIDNKYLNQFATKELSPYFDFKAFDFPKPTTFILDLISFIGESDFIILDFFAGSGTTGDAVMQLNAEDGGNRKFILVQLPEPIDPKKNKVAYDFVKNELKAEPTIFEITKERLLRATKKINAGLDEKITNLELQITKLKGEIQTDETTQEIENLQAEITKNSTLKTKNCFKVFETQPIWEDYNFEAEQFDSSQTLFDVGKLTEDDIKALLTTWKTYDGIALTQELESIDLSGYTAYYGNGRLYLMHKGFTTDSLKALLEKIDADKHFEPKSIIAFGYHFESKSLREISENVKTYNNKKKSDIDFITRY
jgi:adenine-specific DNA-methyltransferase